MTSQFVAALESQVKSLVDRMETGGEDGKAAHDQLLELARDAGSEFADMFDEVLEHAAEIEDARLSAEKEAAEVTEEYEKRQESAACQPELKPMSHGDAAKVLERSLRKPEAAAAVRGAAEAIEEENVEDLMYVLETFAEIPPPYGRLGMTLRDIVEQAVCVLLTKMLEQYDESQELFAEARQARGLRYDGLRNRAIAAIRFAKSIRFNPVGLAVIERLIRTDSLPDVVLDRVASEALEEMKQERKPATSLLAHLRPKPPERKETSTKPRQSVMREGKTSFDRAKRKSENDRAAADRAYRNRMKGSHEERPLIGKGRKSPRRDNDPNARKPR